jgi:hypothetical protein
VPIERGENPLTVDTGFDAVLAGEVWTEPEQVTAAVTEPVTATVTSGLTPAGVQAAKALVVLPDLKSSDLAKLAREIAMDIKERHVVLKEHGLSQAQYDFLEAHNEFYKSALSAACIEWHAPLSTQERIKVEAAAILEDSLLGLGLRMQNKSEGLPGVIEAAKLFAKVAGVGEREVGSSNSGERFVINIDLGGGQKITASTTPTQIVADAPDPQPALLHDPKGKDRDRRYREGVNCRLAKERYDKSVKGRERRRRYDNGAKGRERAKAYDTSPKGRERRFRHRYPESVNATRTHAS